MKHGGVLPLFYKTHMRQCNYSQTAPLSCSEITVKYSQSGLLVKREGLL